MSARFFAKYKNALGIERFVNRGVIINNWKAREDLRVYAPSHPRGTTSPNPAPVLRNRGAGAVGSALARPIIPGAVQTRLPPWVSHHLTPTAPHRAHRAPDAPF